MKQKLYAYVPVLSILLFVACADVGQEPTIDLTEATGRSGGLKGETSLGTDTFRSRFNEYLSQMGTPYAISAFRQSKDSGIITIDHRFNTNILLTGKLGQASGAISEATLVMGSDGSQNAAIEIIMMMSGLVKTTNPDLSLPEVEQVLTRIGMFDQEQDLSRLDTTIVIKGVQYHALFIDDLGFMFTAIMQQH